MAGIAVTRLSLSGFRCYDHLRLDVAPGSVALFGPNGAGKTNILEALSLLVPGRGLRGARLPDVVKRDLPPDAAWGIAAALDTPDGRLEIGTGRDPNGGEKRAVRIDGHPAKSQADLGRHLAAVWLTPSMDRLFLEGPGGRRRFLDRLVLGQDPDHAGRSSAYEHALRERAKLLKEGRGDAAWLSALEDTMVRHGMALTAARREALVRLNAACAEDRGPFPRAALRLTGGLEQWLEELPALEAEDRFRAALERARPTDAEHGGAAAGPHRADLIVVHLGKGLPAEQCSTGEQKAVLIAMLLAQARVQTALRGAPPLLLLDEVAAHLDRERRLALFDAVDRSGAQAWMTGTDRELFSGLEGKATIYRVADAALTPITLPEHPRSE